LRSIRRLRRRLNAAFSYRKRRNCKEGSTGQASVHLPGLSTFSADRQARRTPPSPLRFRNGCEDRALETFPDPEIVRLGALRPRVW
jgi:hypothetical protein